VFRILTLNYVGYCFEEERYLSREEVIQIAINKVFESYYSPDVRRYEVKDGKTILVQPNKNHIYYESVDEFLKINPDCCEFDRYTVPGRWFSYLKSGLMGNNLTGVKIKFKIRYYDKNGGISMYQYPNKVYVRLTNCGKV
jgi:hypothetical protein